MSNSVIRDIYVLQSHLFVSMKSSEIILKNILLKNNTVLGFANIASESSFTIMNCSISENTFSNCFMIMDGSSSAHIVKGTVTKNIGLGSSNFIKAQHSRIILENTLMVNNTLKGKLVNQQAGTFEAGNCKFENNIGSLGGVFSCAKNGSVKLFYSIFENNKALSNGGVLYSDNCEVTVKDCSFQLNKAKTLGGCIAAINSHLQVKNFHAKA